MGLQRSPRSGTILAVSLLLLRLVNAQLDCKRGAHDKGKSFDLSALDGPKTVIMTEDEDPSYVETAFTIDICKPLLKTRPEGENCPTGGTRVCGVTTTFNPVEHVNVTTEVIPIAGDFTLSGGGSGHLDPHWTRLSTSAVADDRKKEGIRLMMGGGFHKHTKMPQKAVVEFLCLKKDDEEKEERRDLTDRDDDGEDKGEGDEKKDEERKKKESTDDGDGGTLRFISYETVEKSEVLTLEWRTEHACETLAEGSGESSSGHWGFFTWFIIIIFLAVAAYLIFGSWLNYNRYSARGWDLVPHSETLRDIPYIFKDWMRRVINTVQGGGSRGGYSAV